MPFEYAIVLTGSIATGKSSATKIFASFGFTIIDADSIAHIILNEQYVKVTELFGDEVREGSKINRKVLGAMVFSDTNKRTKLEALLHPLIYKEIERLSLLEDKLRKPYFIDIPLFFENGRYDIEKSLVVYTPKEIQLERLMQRNSYTKEEALTRIALQIDIEKKKLKATYVIDNSKDLAYLNYECARVKNKILGDFK